MSLNFAKTTCLEGKYAWSEKRERWGAQRTSNPEGKNEKSLRCCCTSQPILSSLLPVRSNKCTPQPPPGHKCVQIGLRAAFAQRQTDLCRLVSYDVQQTRTTQNPEKNITYTNGTIVVDLHRASQTGHQRAAQVLVVVSELTRDEPFGLALLCWCSAA